MVLILRNGGRAIQSCIKTVWNKPPTVLCHPSPGPGRCFLFSTDKHTPLLRACCPCSPEGNVLIHFPTRRLNGEGEGKPVAIGPTTHKLHFSPTGGSLWIYLPQSDRWEQLSNLKAWGQNTYSKMFPVLLWNYWALLISASTGLCCPELGLAILGNSRNQPRGWDSTPGMCISVEALASVEPMSVSLPVLPTTV